ncbi:MAG: hypothetical protein MZU95_08830 [Desulfomicrobium escambiense]|nr:hypothetical protein [Desulfomicrobium escambiense]
MIRNGSGYPSVFNADEVVLAQTGMGKRLMDAREGGPAAASRRAASARRPTSSTAT